MNSKILWQHCIPFVFVSVANLNQFYGDGDDWEDHGGDKENNYYNNNRSCVRK